MRNEAVAVGLQVTCDRCIEEKQDICLHSEYLFPSLFIKKGKVLTLEWRKPADSTSPRPLC